MGVRGRCFKPQVVRAVEGIDFWPGLVHVSRGAAAPRTPPGVCPASLWVPALPQLYPVRLPRLLLREIPARTLSSVPSPSRSPCGLVRKAGRLLLLLAARELEADSRPERGGTVLLALGQLRWPLCVLALSFPSAGLCFLSPDAVDRLAEDYYFF